MKAGKSQISSHSITIWITVCFFYSSVPCKVAGLEEVMVTSKTPNRNLFANAEHMASFAPAAFPVHAKENMIHSSVPNEHGSKRFLNAYSLPGGKVLNHGTSKSSHKIQVDVPLLPHGPRWYLFVQKVGVLSTAVKDKPEKELPIFNAWPITGLLLPQLIMIMKIYTFHKLVIVCYGRRLTLCNIKIV